MSKQHLKIFIMTIIIGAFMMLLGTTYAYFQVRIIENKNEKSIEVTSKILEVTYSDGTAEFTGSKDGYIFPGEIFKKYWSVENTGDDIANFDIVLRNITNTFERNQDWTYKLGIVSDTNNDGLINSLDTVNYLTENPIQFPNSSEKVTNYQNRTLAYNAKETYILIVEYANSEEDQTIDMNKELTATIDIASSEVTITE